MCGVGDKGGRVSSSSYSQISLDALTDCKSVGHCHGLGLICGSGVISFAAAGRHVLQGTVIVTLTSCRILAQYR